MPRERVFFTSGGALGRRVLRVGGPRCIWKYCPCAEGEYRFERGISSLFWTFLLLACISTFFAYEAVTEPSLGHGPWFYIAMAFVSLGFAVLQIPLMYTSANAKPTEGRANAGGNGQ